MTNWPTKKLGEVAYFQEGPGLRTFQFKPNGIRVINVANVRNGFLDLSTTKFLDPDEVQQKYKHFLVNENDILVSTSGTIGRVAWIVKNDLPLMLNTSVMRFHTLDEKILLNRFLFYFLSGSIFRNEILKYKTGVAIFNVGPSHIKKIKIPLPPLQIQKQIVERLDKIVEAQKLNDDLIQKSNELYRSLLHNELNVKFKNQNAKSQFKIKKLGEICDIYQPQTITSNEIVKEGPFKVFGANGVIGYYSKYNHEDSEVLVTCRGATCGTLNMSEPKSWITGNAMVVRPQNKKTLSKEFLFYSLKNSNLRRTITGTGQPQITRNSLSPFQIILPPLETQKQIVSKLSAVQDYKTQLLAQKSKLKELFESVLAKSFKGEL